MKEHLKTWFCCVSYIQENATERNLVNVTLQQDQFPKIKEVQEQLEKEIGGFVECVVLINWKEIKTQ